MPRGSLISALKSTKCLIIGMIHVRSLPGTPNHRLTFQEIKKHALKEANIYRNFNVDAVIVENMHDTPYLHSNDIGHEIVAYMTAICQEVRHVLCDIPVGTQILAGGNKQALAAAHASGLDFIRAEGFVFSHIADEGLMNACAGPLLRYRHNIGADHLEIFVDIKKKHSSHVITDDISIAEMAKAAEFFQASGLIVTGTSTGKATNVEDINSVKVVTDRPVVVGSGVTIDNLSQYKEADGLIIGSHFKENGHWQNEIDETRLQKFMNAVIKMRDHFG